MQCDRLRGFTLIELLLAISAMSIVAIMAWRALDGMQRTNSHARAHTDAVQVIDAGLGQWIADLDHVQTAPHIQTLQWDGRTLRLTRRHSVQPQAGLVVVAWTRNARQGQYQWLRWQSEPVHHLHTWQQAWQAAALWAENTAPPDGTPETAIVALDQWQIYYFRGGSWSNPLSSPDTGAPNRSPSSDIPEGIRLVLELPAGHPLGGRITRDWAALHQPLPQP